MSRQEIKAYGKQEFGKYPLITMEPLPETLSDYFKIALRGDTGVRVKNPKKHLECHKTAKTYLYWDNLVHHYKHLAPLFGKPIEFKEYICPHDGWLFNYSENLRLHNKIVKVEQAAANEIERRLNLDNPDYKIPGERTEQERYYVADLEHQLVSDEKGKSRFLRKERPHETKRSDELEDPFAKPVKAKKKVEDTSKVVSDEIMAKAHVEERTRTAPEDKCNWPYDPEDLDPIPRPPPKPQPAYFGWTHSADADSWYLEARTPSQHQTYERFYDHALRKKVICPKLYSTVC